MNDLHESSVVFPADMLEHAYGDDFVKPALDLPVVTLQDRDLFVLTVCSGIPNLLLRNVHGGDGAAILFGGVLCESTPAAANVQHPVVWLEIDFLGDKIELLLLRLVQVFRSIEIGTTVLIVRIEI